MIETIIILCSLYCSNLALCLTSIFSTIKKLVLFLTIMGPGDKREKEEKIENKTTTTLTQQQKLSTFCSTAQEVGNF